MSHSEGHVDHHEHEEHIHMPAPSLSPIILAVGMCLLGFAIAPTIFRIPFVVLGVLLTGYGLYTWIYDEVKNAESAEEAH
jgi:hypothetical protein